MSERVVSKSLTVAAAEVKQCEQTADGAIDVRYADMCRAIAQCHQVDEVKQIRDKALALEIYSKQARNTDAERRAADIRLRAERRAGVLLEELAEAEMRETRGGDRKSKSTSTTLIDRPVAPTLANLGITRDQSSKWQQLAKIPEAQFDAALCDSEKKPSTAALIRAIRWRCRLTSPGSPDPSCGSVRQGRTGCDAPAIYILPREVTYDRHRLHDPGRSGE
ncbi:hypothetical protein NOV72_05740 [Caballeronia novacaledonica]|uniref:Uncharacterized protein n=2 Tax=Caballeronia novacaledonica TaxID=1544861 RepID=A0A2U3IE81_9BURK|nr:hypothetical protein NOV72_05740 [Caballeronia novacaledonica]